MVQATQELILLTYAEYTRLRQDLKAAGIDLCYSAQASRPVRLKWSLNLFQQEEFLAQVARRRPFDESYCIASVWLSKKATWFQPDQYIVTFHSVGVLQEEQLQQYLAEHQVQGSAKASREMLTRV